MAHASAKYHKHRSRKTKYSAFKKAVLTSLSLLKPTLTTLAFLLLSQLVPATPAEAPSHTAEQCVSSVLPAAVASVMGGVGSSDHQRITVGTRTLILTKHAAQRIRERGVTVVNIQHAVHSGKLFAYAHGGLIKIGYYDEAARVFLAVDHRHEKIITAIRNSPRKYMVKLLGQRPDFVRSAHAK